MLTYDQIATLWSTSIAFPQLGADVEASAKNRMVGLEKAAFEVNLEPMLRFGCMNHPAKRIIAGQGIVYGNAIDLPLRDMTHRTGSVHGFAGDRLRRHL